MIPTLNEIIEANKLLISVGGEDQMPRLAAVAIERSLQQQHRIERALKYAAEAPPNSMHAKNMARILDGSITLDDELQEVRDAEARLNGLQEQAGAAALPAPRRTRGPGKKQRGPGLAGRSTKERKEFRAWMARQQDAPVLPMNGPVPQQWVDAFDEARARGALFD